MRDELLKTKFLAPQLHRAQVARHRLYDRLEEGVKSRLTTVSAPAGFGKTALLSAWRAACINEDRLIGWLSLDESDDDPTRFWTYVIAALKKVRPDVGEQALILLDTPRSPIESILSSLINDVVEVSQDLILVLDDYHLVRAEPIHCAVGFLLAHAPPQMHLVVSGRTDPPLPLARLRARGQLTELRAADLRFIFDEAIAFLNGVMDLSLSERDVSA